MADEEEVNIGGKQLSTLRVVDLKKECDKRGLSKSGSKSQLVERLKTQVLLENLQKLPIDENAAAPNQKLQEEDCQNEFIKQYLQQQKQLIETQMSSSQESEHSADESPQKTKKRESAEKTQSPKSKSPPTSVEISPEKKPSPEKQLSKPTVDAPEVQRSQVKPTQSESSEKTVEPSQTKQEESLQPESQDRQQEESPQAADLEDQEMGRSRRKSRKDVSESNSQENDKVTANKPADRRSNRRRNSRSLGSEQDENVDVKKTDMDNDVSVNIEAKAGKAGGDNKENTVKDEHVAVEQKKESNVEEKKKNENKIDNRVEEKMETNEEKGDRSGKGERPTSRQSHHSSSRSRSRSASPPAQKTRKPLKRLTEQSAKTQQKKRSSRKSSSSSDSSRSRSRSREKTTRKKARTSSSSGSRSRSPSPKTLKKQTPAARNDSRSSSSSRSRSRSPSTKKIEKPVARSRSSSSSRSRSPPNTKQRSRSSSSRSRSTSPAVEPKVQAKTAVPEMQDKQKVEKNEKMSVDPVGKEEKEDGELPLEVPDKSQQQTVEVKVTKKISLRRNIEEPDAEKMEEGEKENKQGDEKPAKKRKWGSRSTSITQKPKKVSSLPISTESLKGLIPDIKPSLKLAPEPIMEDEMDYEDDPVTDPQPPVVDEDTRSVKIQRTIVQEVKDNPDSPTGSDESESEKEDDEAAEQQESSDSEEGEMVTETKREVKEEDKEEEGEDEGETSTKTITVTNTTKEKKPEVKIIRRLNSNSGLSPLVKPDEPEKPRRSPSPARNPISKIIHIRNLVRPFTLPQLKELLKRSGPMVDEAFWIDKIKSHCFVTYENEEDAATTRKSLHNTRWPNSNPKTLTVDFGSEEQLNYYKGDEKPIPPPLKKEKVSKIAVAQKDKEEEKMQAKLREEREKSTERRRIAREKRMKEKKEREEVDKPKPVREWDKDKKRREDWDRTMQTSRSRSPQDRKGRKSLSRERRRERSKERPNREGRERKKVEKKEEEPPAKLLDDLFRKTKATPCIYWLPLTEAQIAEKNKLGIVRPVLRQKQGGDTVSPIRELPDTDRDTRERRRNSVSPPVRRPSPDRSRGRGGPSAERRRQDSSGTARRR